jgi:hypothetical protein
MSKIIDKLTALDIVPGAKVTGLVEQSLLTVFSPLLTNTETIESVTEADDDPNVAIIKTIELSKKTEILTQNGMKPLPVEQRRYAISGTDMLKVLADHDVTKLRAKDAETDEPLELSETSDAIETDFSTLPKQMLNKLAPFINYVVLNKKTLNDIMDIDSLHISIDNVKYDLNTMSKLTKLPIRND